MKLQSLLVTVLATATAGSNIPLRDHDPATVKSCIEWYNNYMEETCEQVLTKWKITPAEFHAWNPSIGTDCKPWRELSYCIVTQEKYDEWQSAHPTTTSSTTVITTTTSATLGPSPTAWKDRGCYSDNSTLPIMQKRITPDAGTPGLTPAKCQTACYKAAYGYSGLKDGNQCWCSPYIAGEWTKDQNDCNTTCNGDAKLFCGGKGCINVYEAVYSSPSVPTISRTSYTKSTSTAKP